MAKLRNVSISFVSLVDKAANKKEFAIVKNEDGTETFKNFCPIIKKNTDKQEVTAIVYEPNVKDSQGDEMTVEEIEKAQRSHAMNGFGSDIQHSFSKEKKLHLVESWITKSDTKIGEQEVKKGTWMQTVFVDDTKIWKSIKEGKFTGFSMGGKGERVEKANTNTETEDETMNLFEKFKKFIGVEKSTFSNTLKLKNKRENYYKLRNTLDESLNLYGSKKINTKDAEASLDDFKSEVMKIIELKNSTIKKEETNVEINEKDLQKMITETVQKAMNPELTVKQQVAKALEEAGIVKKEEGKKEEINKAVEIEDEQITKAVNNVMKAMGYEQKEETFEEKVAKAVAKAVEPMKDNIEKMAKARGYSKANENNSIEKNEGMDSRLAKSYIDFGEE